MIKNKYKKTTVDGVTMHEHRHVMQNILGRKLRKGEIVHHKNGIRHDNRPSNLQLIKNQAKHISLHNGTTNLFHGKKHSNKSRAKMSESHKIWEEKNKGHSSWNKGLTKTTHPQLSNAGANKGNAPWNKNKHYSRPDMIGNQYARK